MRTGRWLKGNIHASYYALHNPELRFLTRGVVEVLYQTYPHFKNRLQLPPDLIIKVGAIKGNPIGRYDSFDRLITIDPRTPSVSLLEVFAHELVHAEQYYQGRLRHEFKHGQGWLNYWEGTKVDNKGTTYARYMSQPWEKEAYARQGPLAAIVRQLMED